MKTQSSPGWGRLVGACGLFLVGLAAFLLGSVNPELKAQTRGTAAILDVRGVIAPALAAYIEDAIEEAAGEHELVVLRMDTPGGLDTSMRQIIKSILASPVPVATYVAPSGSRAASAGTYILYASHIAAMAPGTNVGAATPVQIGGGSGNEDQPFQSDWIPLPDQNDSDEPKAEAPSGDAAGEEAAEQTRDAGAASQSQNEEDEAEKQSPERDSPPSSEDSLRSKAINDAAAYIRGLAELRGRNADWAERAVREAVSVSASEAESLGVIDFVAEDIAGLLASADGREVQIEGRGTVVLQTANLTPVEIEMTWIQEFLNIITDPNIALILMQIGILGLIVELYNPGGIFPGVVGLICLILGLTALSVLPINYGGMALMIAGLLFMFLELFVVSGGILAGFGLIAFVTGTLFMFDADVPGLRPSIWVILVSSGLIGLFIVGIVLYGVSGVRTFGRSPVAGAEAIIGMHGKVVEWNGLEGFVWLDGERWAARSDVPLTEGQEVVAVRSQGLVLWVKPVKH